MKAASYKILSLAVSAAMICAVIVYSKPDLLIKNISSSNFMLVLCAFIIINGALLLRVLKLHVMLYKKIRFSSVFLCQMTGIAASNLTPAKLAEPLKCVMLKKKSGLPVSESAPLVVWERMFDIIVTLLLALPALGALSGALKFLGYAGIAIFSVVLAALLLIIVSRRFGVAALKIFSRLPYIKLISNEFVESFYKTKPGPKLLIISFLFTLAAWALEGAAFYFILQSLGISSTLAFAVGAVCASTLIGVATSLPGGLGSTEVIMALIVSSSGVPAVAAVSAVVLYRLLSFWYNIAIGGVSLAILQK